MSDTDIEYEFNDEELKNACEVIRKSFVELSEDVMPAKKRFMFARHFGKLGIDLIMKRQLGLEYAKQRAEAEAKGEEFKSPFQLLEENKENIRKQFSGSLVNDFECGFEF